MFGSVLHRHFGSSVRHLPGYSKKAFISINNAL